jgi:hypothetical protein
MRQIFSVRFFAAVGAVAGLLFLLSTVFAAKQVIDDDGDGDAGPPLHVIDFVDRVESSSNPSFGFDADGLADVDTVFVIDASRQVVVRAGTPGEDHCGRLAEPGACALVADLLGEGVVWLALVPIGADPLSVPMPAVDTLDGGVATLVNGWQLPHAPAFDRRCGSGENAERFESYRQFKQLMGDDFITIYDLRDRRLTAVVCRQRVPYAPPSSTTLAP